MRGPRAPGAHRRLYGTVLYAEVSRYKDTF